jgi:hypothetical protein
MRPEDSELTFDPREQDALDYFLSLKRNYEADRQSWEHNWEQALVAVYGFHPTGEQKLDKIYNGLANIQSPIMNWKVNGMTARINRIIFNVKPIGRLEDTLVNGGEGKNIIDLWNSYIFDKQLADIDFEQSYKLFQKSKTIQGTAVAKITQEYEEKEMDMFDTGEVETIVTKDNTYFRPILLSEFYSDVGKSDIQESQACIHSTVMSIHDLKLQEKKTITEVYEVSEPVLDEMGNVVGERVREEEEKKEVGVYHNLGLLEMGENNISVEQEEYLQWLGLNKGQTADFKRSLKDTAKTGFVTIDECYGLYPLDGETPEEVICTIANGRVVIRLDASPFRHKKYTRPFIVGTYKPIANCLYGESNVILGLNLLQELNASRGQASDAKTFSVFPMTYIDNSKMTINKWDGQWRPRGIIEGTGANGIAPIVQPYLGQIAVNDSMLIQKDLDQLWSLSPVQEGSSDNRMIPNTASGTNQIIAQNDMPLNDIINNAVNGELKKFIEMLYERNIQFKDVGDLRRVWTDKQIQSAGLIVEGDQLMTQDGQPVTMRELSMDFSVKILGNLELANEINHQMGWERYMQVAQNIPPLAKRTDWVYLGEQLLKAYGIKDDAEGLWLDPETFLEIDQEQQQANQQAQQQEQQMLEQMRGKSKEDYEFKVAKDTEGKVVIEQVRNMADMVNKNFEMKREKETGQKVM